MDKSAARAWMRRGLSAWAAVSLRLVIVGGASALLLTPALVQAQDKEKLDLNAADAAALSKLPGVNAALAKKIVEYRDSKGAFTTVKDLLKVKGVSRAILSKLEARVTVVAPTPEDEEGGETAAEPGGEAAAEESGAGAGTPGLQRSNRMEFDGRLVKGQSAGAGAVFLFERAPRPLPSMVQRRTTFLGDTVQEVFGDQTPQAAAAASAGPAGETSEASTPPVEDKGAKGKKGTPKTVRPR